MRGSHLLGVEQAALGGGELGRRREVGGGHLGQLGLVEPHLAGRRSAAGEGRVGDAADADPLAARAADERSTWTSALPRPAVAAATAGSSSPTPGSGGAVVGGGGHVRAWRPSAAPRSARTVTPSPGSRSSTSVTRWPGSTSRSSQPPVRARGPDAAHRALELPRRHDVDLGALDVDGPLGADGVPGERVGGVEQHVARELVVEEVAVATGDRGVRIADLHLHPLLAVDEHRGEGGDVVGRGGRLDGDDASRSRGRGSCGRSRAWGRARSRSR